MLRKFRYRGLSPLARGTRSGCSVESETHSVYPRWRGEHLMLEDALDFDIGLSPLARGTQLLI